MDKLVGQKQQRIPGQRNPEVVSAWPGRDFPLPWLVGLGLLVLALRLPFIGHVLSWDEAWNLCALKSLAGGGGPDFTLQFWRHPPTYLLLGRLLAPLHPGLDSRMQFLSLALNTGAILAFVLLTSRLFGRQVALYTGLVYSLLPGALFFDSWIKQDPVATLFGVLALWAYFRWKNWLAGLLLGLAFLGKETAVYYAIPYLLLPFCLPQRQKQMTAICLIYGLAAGVAGWWYLQMAVAGGNYLAMFLGTSFEATGFAEPWWYYLARLRIDLGLPGLLLFLPGLAALFRKPSRRSLPWLKQLLRPRLIPLTIVGPVYLLLTLSKGKPAWMSMGLYPPLALIVGCGWHLVSKRLFCVGQAFLPRLSLKSSVVTVISGLLLFLLIGFSGRAYWAKEGYPLLYQGLAPKSLNLLQASYHAADALNGLAKGGEKLLIAPLIYRGAPDLPDPIFFWQLKVPLDVIRIKKECNLDYQLLQEMVVKERVDWVMLSPLVGSEQSRIYQEFYNSARPPRGYVLSNIVLLRVDYLWR